MKDKQKIKIRGFCAYNKGEAVIDNMSFAKTEKEIRKYWGKQQFGKCTIIIEEIL